MLAESISEVRKHESRADFLDSSVCDLQRENLIPIVWKIYCTVQAVKHHKENRLYFMNNWHSEKEHFETVAFEIYMSMS